MPNVLIVGATRGLGAELVKIYASDHSNNVYGTARSTSLPSSPTGSNIKWITGIDLTEQDCAQKLVEGLSSSIAIHILIVTAGYFGSESFDDPDWEKELKMYTTSSIAPVFLVQALVKSNHLKSGSKVVLVSSESGSITLRHETEGGGNYGHHASKAALNMVGKLLSLDLKEKGIAVALVHPGFMRTEMTKGVGFDKFWDAGGAVTPDVAAESLSAWVEKDFDMSKTGTYWAPRGPRDIGTAEPVLGKEVKQKEGQPLQLPW
jgi:short-subunit dehydrogenase